MTREAIEAVATKVVDAVVRVHRQLGPGLLESVYQSCLMHELCKRGANVECEVALPVYYDGVQIEAGYRVDMLVENLILIENKAVQSLLPIHEAQLLTYQNCPAANWDF